jgi:5-methylcytosine-specific restriction endonuclease McrA
MEYDTQWLKEHRDYILSILGRAKQTIPIDDYHVHYSAGSTQPLRPRIVRLSTRKTKLFRAEMYKENQHCFYCAVPLTIETATIDHVIALINHGTNDRKNLVLACEPCNQAKANMPVEEFLKGKCKNVRRHTTI